MKLPICVQMEPKKGFGVSLPELWGCIANGENLDQALANLQGAVELYIDGENLPAPTASDIGKLAADSEYCSGRFWMFASVLISIFFIALPREAHAHIPGLGMLILVYGLSFFVGAVVVAGTGKEIFKRTLLPFDERPKFFTVLGMAALDAGILYVAVKMAQSDELAQDVMAFIAQFSLDAAAWYFQVFRNGEMYGPAFTFAAGASAAAIHTALAFVPNLWSTRESFGNVPARMGRYRRPVYALIVSLLTPVLVLPCCMAPFNSRGGNRDGKLADSEHYRVEAFRDACKNNDDVQAIKMIQNGVDPTTKVDWAPAPVYAVLMDRPKVLRVLLTAGVDVEMRYGNERMTLLMLATANGKLEIMDILLTYGADPDQRSGEGLTPLDYAKKYNRLNILTHFPDPAASGKSEYLDTYVQDLIEP